MSKIYIGSAATDRDGLISNGWTAIDLSLPAAKSGVITDVAVYAHAAGTQWKVGTFYGTPPNFTCRDYVLLTPVNLGLNNFPGLSLNVQVGDYIGVLVGAGSIEESNTGGDGLYLKSGDHTEDGEQTYTLEWAGGRISVHGEGPAKPNALTLAATQIMEQSALGNGNIENDGGASVTQHGVCWKKGADPVNLAGADGYTQKGAGSEGVFTSILSPLFEDTLYYYRAYATNSVETGYGAVQSFKTEFRARAVII